MIITDKTIIKKTIEGAYFSFEITNECGNILFEITQDGGTWKVFQVPTAGAKEAGEMLRQIAATCETVEVPKAKPGRKKGFKLKPIVAVPVDE